MGQNVGERVRSEKQKLKVWCYVGPNIAGYFSFQIVI